MARLWTCTWSPALISRVAKPMIWLYRCAGLPLAISRTAILCPAGMVTMARTFSFVTSVPVGISKRAMTTSSSGCRRMVRSAACSILDLSEKPLGQPQHDFGHIRAERQRREERHEPRQDRNGSALERKFSHAREHEQYRAHGWVQQADHEVQHHDQAKVHGVDAQLEANRHEDRHEERD